LARHDRLIFGKGGTWNYSPAFGSQQVMLGIRPEDLELGDNDDTARSLITNLVEHLGADTLVHGHIGDNQTDMTIRLSGIQNFEVGEALPMHIEPDKIHLFDATTEKRLG
jgi:sn-glycerol 3-phosphate transport system ATP-binding protein